MFFTVVLLMSFPRSREFEQWMRGRLTISIDADNLSNNLKIFGGSRVMSGTLRMSLI
jgi:hypothetical protein